eukprot:scpid66098/ scgid27730/ 
MDRPVATRLGIVFLVLVIMQPDCVRGIAGFSPAAQIYCSNTTSWYLFSPEKVQVVNMESICQGMNGSVIDTASLSVPCLINLLDQLPSEIKNEPFICIRYFGPFLSQAGLCSIAGSVIGISNTDDTKYHHLVCEARQKQDYQAYVTSSSEPTTTRNVAGVRFQQNTSTAWDDRGSNASGRSTAESKIPTALSETISPSSKTDSRVHISGQSMKSLTEETTSLQIDSSTPSPPVQQPSTGVSAIVAVAIGAGCFGVACLALLVIITLRFHHRQNSSKPTTQTGAVMENTGRQASTRRAELTANSAYGVGCSTNAGNSVSPTAIYEEINTAAEDYESVDSKTHHTSNDACEVPATKEHEHIYLNLY